MKPRGILASVLSLTVLVCALCAVLLMRPADVGSSLYDLVGAAADSVPSAVRDASNNAVPILISSSNRNDAVDAAGYLASRLPVDGCRSVRFLADDSDFDKVLDFYSRNRSGLVSAQMRELLQSAEGRSRLARRAVKNAYSSLDAPLFPVDTDPFALTDGFVKSLSALSSSFKPDASGFLAAEKDGVHNLLLMMELENSLTDDINALIAFRERLEDVLREVRSGTLEVNACGVPMHSALSASKCRSETTVLGCASLLFVLILSLFLFRSVKSIFLVAYLLLFSALGGSTALIFFFPRIHVVTILFATTLLGLVIDYGYHWMMHRSADSKKTVRNLFISFVTTEFALLPLLFSSIPVLRQSAVFIGVGLSAALFCVVFLFPDGCSGGTSSIRRISPPVKLLRFTGVVAFLVFLAGLFTVEFKTRVTSLYAPPAELAGAERTLAEINGTSDECRGFLVVGGSDDLETLLEKEERLGLPRSVPSLSRFMPSLKKRLEWHEKVVLLYREHGESVKNALGIKSVKPPPPPRAWRWTDVPDSLNRLFVRDGSLIVASSPEPAASAEEGVSFCRPRFILEDILAKWTREIKLWLFASFAVMLAVLLFAFGRKAITVAFPSAAAVLSAIGFISMTGEPVNLFHLLALFLLVGMGVDYAVFARTGDENSVQSVTLAFLTSFVGFGALVFVSFPVVRAFGLSLGVGLPVAYLTSLVLVPRKDTSEYASTPVGLAMIWAVYNIFGLRFFHFVAHATGFFMWIFSPGVRRASPKLGKIVNFTHSLADKMVVMADGKSKPVVALDDSPDAKDFIGDVRARKGVFVISSHVGTIEVLAALGECEVTFHAWMEFSRTGVFNDFYLKHQRKNKVVIHPISGFNPGTVLFAGSRLDEGDAILMAGDRSFGRKRTENVDGREVELAEGVFRLASALEHPVYFVSCISVSDIGYRVNVKRLPSGAREMAHSYALELLRLRDLWPLQNFTWET